MKHSETQTAGRRQRRRAICEGARLKFPCSVLLVDRYIATTLRFLRLYFPTDSFAPLSFRARPSEHPELWVFGKRFGRSRNSHEPFSSSSFSFFSKGFKVDFCRATEGMLFSHCCELWYFCWALNLVFPANPCVPEYVFFLFRSSFCNRLFEIS